MLNQNYSESVSINVNQLEWEASPMAGVWRKKLERESAESGRATSIVKYEPGSVFSEHVHTGGEEIYVIDGVFSDETGNYPAGSYFRNPPGTAHSPYSDSGCTLFVKLCYFREGDNRQLVLQREQLGWQQGKNNDEQVFPLHQFHREVTTLVTLAPNTQWDFTHTASGREILVLEGELRLADQPYPALSWLRFASHDARFLHAGPAGATLLFKTGHLLHLEENYAN
ncbi:cupin domain-containing protein [Alteromonas sp. ASW11-19]|uniref:Cupin domain-containing protein n=1 Tax=Alteromonas salexigens TaxID=2982530 RepID=A0ABT2VMP3_9ALTE|nr:cupin domain-containing protein [Alteromonas salexigens]MCU7554585.1 cupin domain-containing protein [Alteromonas salexigens]